MMHLISLMKKCKSSRMAFFSVLDVRLVVFFGDLVSSAPLRGSAGFHRRGAFRVTSNAPVWMRKRKKEGKGEKRQ
jgi:hypothetical protein